MPAAGMGRAELVRKLLEKGADINAKDVKGKMAWEYACDPPLRKLLWRAKAHP